ncbi:hypothetical protein EDC94DRAFT_588292 [Helicostylum pulchrum]|nr:hypothetical protein EDC94DRAFT_588292 [Helicostylum pulchrum]
MIGIQILLTHSLLAVVLLRSASRSDSAGLTMLKEKVQEMKTCFNDTEETENKGGNTPITEDSTDEGRRVKCLNGSEDEGSRSDLSSGYHPIRRSNHALEKIEWNTKDITSITLEDSSFPNRFIDYSKFL